MARRLTDQQRRRIAQRQTEHRDAVKHAAPPTEDDAHLGPEQRGLVLARYGAQADVEDAHGQLHRCHLRATLAPLVTGDRVVMRLPIEQTADARGVVIAIEDRRSLLGRPDARGQWRPVAANVDYLLLTIAPAPAPFTQLIDRYLVAAHRAGITPVLVCNKSDWPVADPSLDALLQVYRDIGYPVHRVSCQTGDGLAAIRELLSDHTAVVAGQSGVGKSSLVSALLPGIDIAIGALSEAEEKGRHTTTTARFYRLPTGGALIDSPGIREFTLPPMPSSELLSHFIELHTHANHCRFRDCQHDREPGCAVQQAVADGHIHAQRLESYHAIRHSLPPSR